MEDVKSKESIKHQLGGDGVKKKIIIKKNIQALRLKTGAIKNF